MQLSTLRRQFSAESEESSPLESASINALPISRAVSSSTCEQQHSSCEFRYGNTCGRFIELPHRNFFSVSENNTSLLDTGQWPTRCAACHEILQGPGCTSLQQQGSHLLRSDTGREPRSSLLHTRVVTEDGQHDAARHERAVARHVAVEAPLLVE